jgi:sugar O-acyltransferase (sialic acid O-acetyltransferase NeuD family)
LAILGASGHGKVVADCAEACGWQQVVFFDDAWPEVSQNGHWPVTGKTEDLLAGLASFDGVLVAIGNNRIRRDKLMMLEGEGAALITVVHPAAVVSQYAHVGSGSVVFAGAVVNADARMGMGAIVNTGASIDHDCSLGDCVHVSPGARLAGGVAVGDLSWIGIGAVVKQSVKIGGSAIVGAGAAVVKDVSDGQTVIGVPARAVDHQ